MTFLPSSYTSHHPVQISNNLNASRVYSSRTVSPLSFHDAYIKDRESQLNLLLSINFGGRSQSTTFSARCSTHKIGLFTGWNHQIFHRIHTIGFIQSHKPAHRQWTMRCLPWSPADKLKISTELSNSFGTSQLFKQDCFSFWHHTTSDAFVYLFFSVDGLIIAF